MLYVLPVHAFYSCSASQSSQWQICGPIVSNNGPNVQPSVIQISDGTLGMAWTGRPINTYIILYSTGSWNGTGWDWSGGVSIANSAGVNENPSLVQLQNGTLMLIFVYKSTTAKHNQLFYIKYNGGAWSKTYTPIPVSNPKGLNDTTPSTTIGKDGTLNLVWTRDNSTTGSANVMRQLWYKTLKGNVWSTEQNITSPNDPNWNFEPSVASGKDGVVRIAYSSGVTPNFQVKYMTYNGVSWSTPYSLTTQTTTDDDNPSIMQDRNGTIWVFWTRDIQGTTSFFQIYARSSTTNGVAGSWTPETALTLNNCGTTCPDSEYPAAVQSTVDKNIWIFYSYNPGANFNIWALKTVNPISPVHDMSISYFSPNVTSTTMIFAGGYYNTYTATGTPIYQSADVQILVVLANLGDYLENVTLTLTATNTTNYTIGVQHLQIPSGTLQYAAYFLWNTTNAKPARYGLSGNASIPVETLGNKQDGLLSTTNLIHLKPRGDVDNDGADTITDVSIVFYDYGFTCYTPSTCSPRYLYAIYGSFDNTGIIDIVDVGVVLYNFGTVT